MITIKYEIYHNDYNIQTNLTKTFSSLRDFSDWLLEFATPYYKDGYKFLNVDFSSCPNGIKARDYDADKDITVHFVETEDGIVFSDGRYTSAIKHISAAFMEYLKQLDLFYCNPTKTDSYYKFVD